MNPAQIYRGESMGLVLRSNTPLDGWDVAAKLFTSLVDYSIVCARPSREGMIPIEYKDQTLTIDIPASETAKLSEGSLYLHLTLMREDAVKKATIHLAEVLPPSLIACRRTTVGQQLVFVENEIEMTIDMGPSIPSDGDSAYELFQLHNPESTLTEQEYAQAPIVAAEVAVVAVRDLRAFEEQVQTNEGARQTAEESRVNAESSRRQAEAERTASEEARTTTETQRTDNEQTRTAAEQIRTTAEVTRASEERARIEAEATRTGAEQIRSTSETSRKAAETKRTNAETARTSAEQKRHTDTASAIDRTDKATEAAKAAAQSITDPLAILAHSDCTLEERITNLEQLLLDALTGKMYIHALKVQHFEAWGDVNLVLTGSGAPTRSPDKAGQFYVDTLNRVLYFATGNNAVLDWK